MAIGYTYDPSANRVRTRVTGCTTASDFAEYCERVLADDRIQPGFVETLDVAADSELKLAFRDCVPFAAIWERYVAKGLRGTIVLPRNPTAYGVFRMFAGVIDSDSRSPGVEFRLAATEGELETRVRELGSSPADSTAGVATG